MLCVFYHYLKERKGSDLKEFSFLIPLAVPDKKICNKPFGWCIYF